MTEINCPMCGKENPAELEFCQFCQARLQPPGWEPPPAEDPSLPEDSIADEDLPDWLKRLRGESYVGESEPVDSSTTGDQPEDVEPAGVENEEDEDVPDWLRRIRELKEEETTSPSEEQPPERTDQEQEDDSLSPFSIGAFIEDEAFPFIEQPETDESENLRFSDSPVDQTDNEDTQPSSEGQPEAGVAGSQEREETEEWLESLRQWQGTVENESETETDKSVDDLEKSSPGSSSAMPDWLREFEDRVSKTQDPDVREDAKIPDWMQTAPEQNGLVEDSADGEEIPVWLKPEDGEMPDRALESGNETARAESKSEERPEWLDSFVEEEATTAPPQPEKPGQEDPLESSEEMQEDKDALETMPDWLFASVEGEDTPEETPSEVAHAATEAAADGWDLPEWLKEVENQEDSGLTGDRLDWLASIGSESDLQEALDEDKNASRVFSFEEDDQSDEKNEPLIPPFADDDLSEWLGDDDLTIRNHTDMDEGEQAGLQPGLEEFLAEEPEKGPLVQKEMPDWSGSEDHSELASSVSEVERDAAESGGMQPADLPDWLEALRPIEGKKREEKLTDTAKILEGEGPLAGLYAIPSAEELISQYSKPPIYSTKLQISEKSRAHALLLEKILESEKKTQVEKPVRQVRSSRLARLTIGLVMIGILLLQLLTAGVRIPAGNFSNAASGTAFMDRLSLIPDGSVVLVAAEFEPGYSAELTAASTGALQHLMAKGVFLTFISTTPAGPVLAEGLMYDSWVALARSDQESAAAYSFSRQFINLGYLPGGVASLQEFRLRPQHAVRSGFNDAYRDLSSWEMLTQLGVNSLSQFSAVIVVTDDFDSGRAWLEQVQPGLSGAPMMLIATAQASPLFQPYVQSKQATGLLAGLADGIAYEQRSGIFPQRADTWSAYQAGVYLAVTLLLAGMLYQTLSMLFSRKPTRKGVD